MKTLNAIGHIYVPKKSDVIAKLQRDILLLQGFRNLSQNTNVNIGLHSIESSFPNSTFPIGCIHEFLTSSIEDIAATNGFITSLLSRLRQNNGVCVWVSASGNIFPSALKRFCIEPHQIIFIDLKNEKDLLWTIEETLKCERLTAVVGEVKEINFTESRRLQLATEKSRVTGFIIRNQPRVINTTACIARWRITSLSAELADGMLGVGFPKWNVELLKVRNGTTGSWKIEWFANQLRNTEENIFSIQEAARQKTG
jgi:protein ImuA